MDHFITLPFGLNLLAASNHRLGSAIVGMVLYGSTARGEASETSDIDVLILIESTFPIRREIYTALDSIRGIDPRISLSLAHLPKEEERPGSLWLEISRDGIILSDRNGQIAKAIDRIHKLITTEKIMRHETHGQGYWVHA